MEMRLSDLMAAVPISANKDIRYYLCGVCIDDGHIVATNGHMLVVLDCPATVGCASVILPRDALIAYGRLVGKANWGKTGFSLTIDREKNRARLADITETNVSEFPLVDGSFPNWKRVLPSDTTKVHQGHAHFNPEYLMDMEEAARTYANCKKDGLVLTRVWVKDDGTRAMGYVTSNDYGFQGVIMPIRD